MTKDKSLVLAVIVRDTGQDLTIVQASEDRRVAAIAEDVPRFLYCKRDHAVIAIEGEPG